MPKQRSLEKIREVQATKRIEYARPELITQVAELYQEGLGGTLIGRRLDISSNAVFRILERAGIPRDATTRHDHRGKLSTEQRTAVVEQYSTGALLTDLAEQYGCSLRVIKKALQMAGCPLRPMARQVPPETMATILAWDDEQISATEIGRRLGWSQPYISRLLRAAGRTEKRQVSGALHGAWKGGRVQAGDGGYYAVLVGPNDPMASMAQRHTGYVLEHRLVMARSFGRPLLKTETVHHINGDKGDNRLENLQLRQEKHGKHVVYRCLDCGSSNIHTVPIAAEA